MAGIRERAAGAIQRAGAATYTVRCLPDCEDCFGSGDRQPCQSAYPGAEDAPDFAAALLRVTGEEMRMALRRKATVDCVLDGADCNMRQPCPTCTKEIEGIMALILSTAEGQP